MPVVTVMTQGLHACLWAAAMKNQTDCFYTTSIVFAGRSVYTTLFEPSLPSIQWLSLVRARVRAGPCRDFNIPEQNRTRRDPTRVPSGSREGGNEPVIVSNYISFVGKAIFLFQKRIVWVL